MGWLKDIVKQIKPIDLISGGVGIATRIVAPNAATAINAGRLVVAGTIATGGIIGGAAGAVVAKGTNSIASAAVQSEVKEVSTSPNNVGLGGVPKYEASVSKPNYLLVVGIFLVIIYIVFKWK